MKKHFFFDMDGTLTLSRQPMGSDVEDMIYNLWARQVDIVVVSGAAREQMEKQIPKIDLDLFYTLSQNGNVAFDMYGKSMWKNQLDWQQTRYVLGWIHNALAYMEETFDPLVTYDVPVSDLVELRGSQISFSLIGHNAPIVKKKAFDPDGRIRAKLLKELPPFDFPNASMRVAIGGTTCLDFYIHSKGANIARLAEAKGWKPEDCVYFGDALYPGGNDSSVIGVMEAHNVTGPDYLLRVIQSFV